MNYFNILRALQKGDKDFFCVSVEEQKSFLNTLGDPADDIDRSFKQYLCQFFFVPKRKQILFNLFSFIVLPFLVLYLLIKRVYLTKSQPVEAIFESKNMLEILPTELKNRFSIKSDCWDVKPSLSIRDLRFCWRIYKVAPIHCYFALKSLMNLARYSAIFYKYAPMVIIRHSEYSFSSSLLTAYCNSHGARHIDVMHGEKLFFIRDAFFHFDECYVWADYYAALFKSMKAEPAQFHVALPPSMQIEVERYKKPTVFSHYKYYLALYTEEQIKEIVQSMDFAIQQGKTVKYRPHPRYSNMALLKKYVAEEEIEYPQAVPIIESISNVEYAVGSYTTVLSQAWFSGRGVILDDVTFKKQYDQLKERGYFLSNIVCDKLSLYQ